MPAQRFHWLKVRATAHATEDVERVVEAIQALVGPEADVEATLIDSHHGGDVHLLESALTRQAEVRRALMPALRSVAAQIGDELEARVDDDGVLYFRLDKQEAFQGRLRLTAGGDAVQCRAKIEVHPTGRERALAAWAAWLADL